MLPLINSIYHVWTDSWKAHKHTYKQTNKQIIISFKYEN